MLQEGAQVPRPQGSPQPGPRLVPPFTSAAPGNGGSDSFSSPQRHHDCPHLPQTSLPFPLPGGRRRAGFRLSLALLVGAGGVGAELEPPIGEREGRGAWRRSWTASGSRAGKCAPWPSGRLSRHTRHRGRGLSPDTNPKLLQSSLRCRLCHGSHHRHRRDHVPELGTRIPAGEHGRLWHSRHFSVWPQLLLTRQR